MGRAKAPEILREAVQPSRLATDTRWQRTTQPSNGKWRSLPTPGAPGFRGMEETSGGVHREPGTLLAALPLAEESNQSRAQPPLLMVAASRLYGGRVSLSVVVPTNPAGAASLAPAGGRGGRVADERYAADRRSDLVRGA